ncbi:hypothetical protein FQA39_LY08752 [Lamprigera yunnana]|nr:hypothetical protein FQA39_LY08752 [Lamprigera yunnana]
MHTLIRTPHHYRFFKNCNQSNHALKCLYSESDQMKKHSSVHFQIVVPKSNTHLQHGSRIGSLSNSCTIFRNFSLTHIHFDKEPLKPSSKVEVTVQEIIKKKVETPVVAPTTAVVKKSLKQKIVDELVHYYHGFRLLFIDIKISTGLVIRILRGKTLTRREHRLLIRTVGDMFRLVPFSVFIIVPFMEFLLPVFIKFFPGMLPSTFESSSDKENKIKKNLKVKIEMARFLQKTLDDMALVHNDHNSAQAKEFNQWVSKMRTSGEEVTNQEIMKYSKLFEDEITLDSLSRNQIIALCRVLECPTIGTNSFLRFQLRMKIRSLIADDKMIQREGVDSLTLSEVQQACRARGIRAYGVSELRLRDSLRQWLDLSLNEKVPPSLLLLSRALMLPEAIPTHDKLKATISSLPETIMTQTQAAIGEKEGKIDNKVKLEILKEEERKMKEERKEELIQEKKKKEQEILVDKAPVITADATPTIKDTAKIVTSDTVVAAKVDAKEELDTKDLEVLGKALETVTNDKQKFIVEKEVIQDLKEEMADYHEDVEDLKRATAHETKPTIKETKAAQRLFKRVNKMIGKLDSALEDLEHKEKELKKDLETKDTDKQKEKLLQIDDILEAIKQIKDVRESTHLEQIKAILGKIDADSDGSIKVEDVLKVIEAIGKENVTLSNKQVDELVSLLEKEEILVVEDKIEKALQRQKEKKQVEAVKSEEKKTNTGEELQTSQKDVTDSKMNFKTIDDTKTSTPSKTDEQATVISPPPPISSIDPTKSSNNSKTL